MFRIFRKNKKAPGAVQDVQLRPVEQSGVDPLEARLEDTRKQLGKRLGGLLTGRSTVDEDLLDEIETTLITSDIGVQAALEIVENLRAGIRNRVITGPSQVLPAVQAELFELIESEGMSEGCPKGSTIDLSIRVNQSSPKGSPSRHKGSPIDLSIRVDRSSPKGCPVDRFESIEPEGIPDRTIRVDRALRDPSRNLPTGFPVRDSP